jgi:hypothetical protein
MVPVVVDVLLGYAVVPVMVFLCCALVDSCFLGPSALCLVLYVVRTHVRRRRVTKQNSEIKAGIIFGYMHYQASIGH